MQCLDNIMFGNGEKMKLHPGVKLGFTLPPHVWDPEPLWYDLAPKQRDSRYDHKLQ